MDDDDSIFATAFDLLPDILNGHYTANTTTPNNPHNNHQLVTTNTTPNRSPKQTRSPTREPNVPLVSTPQSRPIPPPSDFSVKNNKRTQYGPGSARKGEQLIRIDSPRSKPRVDVNEFPEHDPLEFVANHQQNAQAQAELMDQQPQTTNSPKRPKLAKRAEPSKVVKANTNNNAEEAVDDFPFVNHDPSIEPPVYDEQAIQTWVYPNNYEVREYQKAMVKTALFHNTLVCLPTGLGKTFVAAVVMFNYYRWFPEGIILFVAHTKPLVDQQIEACYSIVGFNQSDIIKLTGKIPPQKRGVEWAKRRVIFATPQVVQNDIEKGMCKAERIVLIVVDEAHRATGNTDFCNLIKEVAKRTPYFRVLGLSATPGSSREAVQHVIYNLLISKIESRTETSPDVVKYLHQKKIEKIYVDSNQSTEEVMQQFAKVLAVPVKSLQDHNVLFRKDPLQLTKAIIYSQSQQFNKISQRFEEHHRFQIMGWFGLCCTLYTGLNDLQTYGLEKFYSWLKENFVENKKKKSSKAFLQCKQSKELQDVIRLTEKKLAEAEANPKLAKLEELVLQSIKESEAAARSSRIMIFCFSRESVDQLVEFLSKHPQIKVGKLTGQANQGLKQNEQAKVLQDFKDGVYNVLVSTSIGEEGLDIGEIDLAICYDTASSPVRMIQRMGRTGRKRDGRVVMLLAPHEVAVQKAAERKAEKMNRSLKNEVIHGNYILYDKSPRMVPNHITPTFVEETIDITETFKGGTGSPKSNKKRARTPNAKEVNDGASAAKKRKLSEEFEGLPNFMSYLSAKYGISPADIKAGVLIDWRKLPINPNVYYLDSSESCARLMKLFKFVRASGTTADSYISKAMYHLTDDQQRYMEAVLQRCPAPEPIKSPRRKSAVSADNDKTLQSSGQRQSSEQADMQHPVLAPPADRCQRTGAEFTPNSAASRLPDEVHNGHSHSESFTHRVQNNLNAFAFSASNRAPITNEEPAGPDTFNNRLQTVDNMELEEEEPTAPVDENDDMDIEDASQNTQPFSEEGDEEAERIEKQADTAPYPDPTPAATVSRQIDEIVAIEDTIPDDEFFKLDLDDNWNYMKRTATVPPPPPKFDPSRYQSLVSPIVVVDSPEEDNKIRAATPTTVQQSSKRSPTLLSRTKLQKQVNQSSNQRNQVEAQKTTAHQQELVQHTTNSTMQKSEVPSTSSDIRTRRRAIVETGSPSKELQIDNSTTPNTANNNSSFLADSFNEETPTRRLSRLRRGRLFDEDDITNNTNISDDEPSSFSSDSSVHTENHRSSTPLDKLIMKKRQKEREEKRRKHFDNFCNLLDDEAEMSGSGHEDDEDIEPDSADDSFVIDDSVSYTQDAVNMEAIYRQSLLSQAALRPENFDTPKRRHLNRNKMKFLNKNAPTLHARILEGDFEIASDISSVESSVSEVDDVNDSIIDVTPPRATGHRQPPSSTSSYGQQQSFDAMSAGPRSSVTTSPPFPLDIHDEDTADFDMLPDVINQQINAQPQPQPPPQPLHQPPPQPKAVNNHVHNKPNEQQRNRFTLSTSMSLLGRNAKKDSTPTSTNVRTSGQQPVMQNFGMNKTSDIITIDDDFDAIVASIDLDQVTKR